jgi:methionyl aminopeptidase
MEIQKGNLEDWRKACKIAAQALDYGKNLIKPGAKAVDVLDKIEEKIIELGGTIAFPAQLNCDSIAAHWCADEDDELVLTDQLICLDVGVCVNGAIGDNATSVDLSGKYEKLLLAPRKALDSAISIIKPDITLSEIGKIIKDTIVAEGFLPIHNLSGHGLDLYNVHSKPTIPNFDTGDKTKLPEGKIIAIEPFATDGAGKVYEANDANIYAFIQKRPIRSPFAREVLKEVEKFNGLPFTSRWLSKKIPKAKLNFGLKELVKANIIREYPPLSDVNKGLVSQAEHTILITKTGCEILTKF